jgi:cytochrome c peroxidase
MNFGKSVEEEDVSIPGGHAMLRAPAVLGVSLVVASSLWACTDETVFTDEERAILSEYRLTGGPPPNPSNRVADDIRAAVLGKKLFFDTRFSGALGVANDGVTNGSLGMAGTTGKVSCHSCHMLKDGGSDKRSKPMATSLGSNYGLRNAPTVINAAYVDVAHGGWQLWAGQKDSLWALSLGPWEGANEHNGSRLQYAHLIYDFYKAEYEAIFDPMPPMDEELSPGVPRFPPAGKPAPMGMPPSPFDMMAAGDKALINRVYSNLGKAIEAYERLLVSTNFEKSPFDKMLEGDDSALSPAAIRGAKLFIGKAACNDCHGGTPLFNDGKFHNIGCPQVGQNVPAVDLGRVGGMKIVKNDVFNRGGAFSDAVKTEHLDTLVLDQPQDVGSFRTPSLRNVERTGPYMHNGVYATLWDVVAHYNFGGGTGSFSGQKESTISPLLLTNDELDDLVEFLRALTDGPPLPMQSFPEGLLEPPMLPQ